MITVKIKQSVKRQVNRDSLQRAAQKTLEFVRADPSAELSIVVGNDALLQRLNSKYRGLDTPTDVLSFPSGEVDPDTHSVYLGDIVISLPRAQDQAFAEDHSLNDELQLLVVHGVLHLLGFDHLESVDKAKMQVAQDVILNQLGVALKINL